MHTLNNPIVTLIALAGFIWLGWYALASQTATHDMHGNKLEDVQAFYDSLKTSDEELLDLYEGE